MPAYRHPAVRSEIVPAALDLPPARTHMAKAAVRLVMKEIPASIRGILEPSGLHMAVFIEPEPGSGFLPFTGIGVMDISPFPGKRPPFAGKKPSSGPILHPYSRNASLRRWNRGFRRSIYRDSRRGARTSRTRGASGTGAGRCRTPGGGFVFHLKLQRHFHCFLLLSRGHCNCRFLFRRIGICFHCFRDPGGIRYRNHGSVPFQPKQRRIQLPGNKRFPLCFLIPPLRIGRRFYRLRLRSLPGKHRIASGAGFCKGHIKNQFLFIQDQAF